LEKGKIIVDKYSSENGHFMCKTGNMLVKKCGAKLKIPIFAGRFEK
jgi:hypothetical protein